MVRLSDMLSPSSDIQVESSNGWEDHSTCDLCIFMLGLFPRQGVFLAGRHKSYMGKCFGCIVFDWPGNSDEVFPHSNVILTQTVVTVAPLQFRTSCTNHFFFFTLKLLGQSCLNFFLFWITKIGQMIYGVWVAGWRHSSSVKLKLIAKKMVLGNGR